MWEGKHLPKFFQMGGLLRECKAECERQQQGEMQKVKARIAGRMLS